MDDPNKIKLMEHLEAIKNNDQLIMNAEYKDLANIGQWVKARTEAYNAVEEIFDEEVSRLHEKRSKGYTVTKEEKEKVQGYYDAILNLSNNAFANKMYGIGALYLTPDLDKMPERPKYDDPSEAIKSLVEKIKVADKIGNDISDRVTKMHFLQRAERQESEIKDILTDLLNDCKNQEDYDKVKLISNLVLDDHDIAQDFKDQIKNLFDAWQNTFKQQQTQKQRSAAIAETINNALIKTEQNLERMHRQDQLREDSNFSKVSDLLQKKRPKEALQQLKIYCSAIVERIKDTISEAVSSKNQEIGDTINKLENNLEGALYSPHTPTDKKYSVISDTIKHAINDISNKLGDNSVIKKLNAIKDEVVNGISQGIKNITGKGQGR